MSIPSYMFDTVVFNRIVDGALDIGAFVGKARFYATHIQLDEINETSKPQRRQALLEVFNRITERKVPTESFILGVSRLDEARLGGGNIVPTESAVWNVSAWGQAKWGEADGLYTAFKAELDTLNKSKPNNVQDTLIAETAIKNRFDLVKTTLTYVRLPRNLAGSAQIRNSLRLILVCKLPPNKALNLTRYIGDLRPMGPKSGVRNHFQSKINKKTGTLNSWTAKAQ